MSLEAQLRRPGGRVAAAAAEPVRHEEHLLKDVLHALQGVDELLKTSENGRKSAEIGRFRPEISWV